MAHITNHNAFSRRGVLTSLSDAYPEPGADPRSSLFACEIRFQPFVVPGENVALLLEFPPSSFGVGYHGVEEVVLIAKGGQAIRSSDGSSYPCGVRLS